MCVRDMLLFMFAISMPALLSVTAQSCLTREQIAWDLHVHHLPLGFLWQAGFESSAPGNGLQWVSYLLYLSSYYVPSETRHSDCKAEQKFSLQFYQFGGH